MITINLPVGTIQTIINIDDPRIEVPIEEALEYLKGEEEPKNIRTMDTQYNIIENNSIKSIKFDYGVNYIYKIKKYDVINNPNMKYFKVKLQYFNDQIKEMIVPSFVKFFTKATRQFTPVEFIGKADALYDYRGQYVRIKSCEEIDFIPKEYYNMNINATNEIQSAFYYNGIYSYIYYINFFKEKEVK